jgi:hypothetical protein
MFRALLSLAGSGLAAAALAVVPASAAKGCAQAILQDWRDGRIDHVYAPACYRQALAYLPEDLRVYSSAETDISRALQARLTTLTERRTSELRTTSRRARAISDHPLHATSVSTTTTTAVVRPQGERAAAAAGATTRANAFPLPVLVGGILALLLVACGPGVAIARRLRR